MGQEKLKVGDKIKSGKMTLANDDSIQFYDLEFVTDGKVKFINNENNQSEFLYLSSLKSIEESENKIYDKAKLDEIEYVKYVPPVPKVETYANFQYKDETLQLKNPSEGKSVVYFVRTNNTGYLINFRHFDYDKFIGKFSGAGFIRYECDPGEHVFWIGAANSTYINANLEAGKIYVIETIPVMGIAYAEVKIDIVDKYNDKKYGKYKKRVFPILAKSDFNKTNSPDLVFSTQEDYKKEIENGIEKYKRREEGEKNHFLHISQYFE